MGVKSKNWGEGGLGVALRLEPVFSLTEANPRDLAHAHVSFLEASLSVWLWVNCDGAGELWQRKAQRE